MDMDNNNYERLPQELAPLLNALAHPARIQIIMHLAKYDACQAKGISERLPLAKSTVSEHLNKLKEVNLISSIPNGNSLFYSLNHNNFNKFIAIFNLFKEKVDNATNNICTCNNP
ncbi:ArsR family transcriptional regulator [Puteibacter caeruleilacunae]|nr:ArsR family transcriptional regulator [Puteibacter caeruleilacunae]